MSVVTRLGGWLLLAGALVGVVLRVSLGRRLAAGLLTVALVLPWALHAGYVCVHALAHGFSTVGIAAFLAAGGLLVVVAVALGRRLTSRRGLLAALMPAALGVAYGLGPFLAVSSALRRLGVALDVLPTAAYAGVCLFASAALLPFAPPGGRGPARGLRDRLRRRP